MNKERAKYFNFPISLLQLFDNGNYDTKEAANNIITYAIVNYMMTINYQIENVAKHSLYLYYRNKKDLHKTILEQLIEMDEKGYLRYDEVDGWVDFDPEDDISDLLTEFKKNEKLKQICILQYQRHLAFGILGLNGGHIEEDLKIYNNLQSIPDQIEHEYGGKDAFTSIRKDIMFDVAKGSIHVDLFLFLAAVKSIIGKRHFNKAYKKTIVSRMLGAKNKEVLEKLLTNSDTTTKKYDSWSKRYRFEKLMDTAIDRGFVAKIPDSRGFFISIKYANDLDAFKSAIMTKIQEKKDNKVRSINAGKEIQDFKRKGA